MIETLAPNDMANSLKLHPFTPPLRAGAGFTVTRLAREGLPAETPARPADRGVGGDPPIPPKGVGGSPKLCGDFVAEKSAAPACPPGFVAGRFRKDQFERWIAKQEPKKPRRSQHHVKPGQIHEYHIKKMLSANRLERQDPPPNAQALSRQA